MEKYEIEIIGYIGEDFWNGGGVTEKMVRQELRKAGGQDVDVLINSHGGDVKEGLGIQTALAQYRGNTRAIITGFASSAASWCAINCDQVTMTEHGFMMIHNTIGMTWGNKADHESSIKELEMMDQQFVNMYAKKTNLSSDRIRNMMDAETMFNADEALENGFIDDIVEINDAAEETTLLEAVNCAVRCRFPGRIIEQIENRVPHLRNPKPDDEPMSHREKILNRKKLRRQRRA